MLDDFREWLSDNLRYILLGLAVILVLVIVFFAVKLIRGGSSAKKGTPETQAVTEQQTEMASEGAADGGTEGGGTAAALTADDPDILSLMTKYYTALAGGDTATLAAVCTSTQIADAERTQLSAVESYQNIKTYARQGMEEGSYIVYTYYEAKIPGIETLAPGLWQHYVVKDTEGNLVIEDNESSAELISFLNEDTANADVQALIADVTALMAQRQAADADLNTFVEAGSGVAADGGTGGTESGTAEGGDSRTMLVTTGVNVRSEASTNGSVYGALYQGMEVEVLEDLDNGWSHITYLDANGVTVDGYMMTQYLAAPAA